MYGGEPRDIEGIEWDMDNKIDMVLDVEFRLDKYF